MTPEQRAPSAIRAERSPSEQPEQTRAHRRRALLRRGSITATLVATSLLAWAVLVEPGCWSVRETKLELPTWEAKLDGLSIAVLTDLHVGAPHIDLETLDDIVEATNAARPDLVVILGDLVIHGVTGGELVEPEPIAASLANLRAEHGVVAVLGNHDWWYDGERVTKALRAEGITVLDDASIEIDTVSPSLWIAGISDRWTRAHDVDRALKDVPHDAVVLAITHNPDVFVDIPRRVALTLAGHTHGGQVQLPAWGPPVVPSAFGRKYAAGHVVDDGRHLFVSVGVGTSILPVRFLVPPRVDVLELHAR